MKSNTASLCLFFALSAVAIQVRCDVAIPSYFAREADEVQNNQGRVRRQEAEDGDAEEPDIKCKDTEEYSRCGANPMCQRNCGNLNLPGIACSKRICIEGCVCKDSFVRSRIYGGCIPVDQCGRVKH